MKKLIVSIIIVIALIICVITLFFKKNNKESSIVFIKALKGNYESEGMGFVYKTENNNNYIITNYHVIDENEEIYVYNLNEEKIKAEIVNYDKYTDIALLKIEDKLNLKETKIGKNNVKEKEFVFYFNVDNSKLEKGKVLDLENEVFLETSYGNSYYKGVSIEGNSGGPILNKNGEVIGLISLKEEGTNVAIYLPIDKVIDIVSKLENHMLIRPNLGGIFASASNKEILSSYKINASLSQGVVILDLTEGYPLKKYGFEVGDIIVFINDEEIIDIFDFRKNIYNFFINDKIKVKFYRNNVYYEKDVILYK